MENVWIVIVSFFCSVGFGIVFRIRPRELWLAGLGGALTRTVLLCAMAVTENRLLFTFLAALAGTFYAHILARRLHIPITKFMYPALVPIIPGDMLYNTTVCMLSVSPEFSAYMGKLILSLLGLALGSMVMPILLNSKKYLRQLIAGPLQVTAEDVSEQ